MRNMFAFVGALAVCFCIYSAVAQTNQRGELGLIDRVSNLEGVPPAPVGAVMAFAGVWPPKKDSKVAWTEDELGWMLCDGRPLNEKVHKQLMLVLGMDKAPDYRGVFLRGVDSIVNGKSSGRDKQGPRVVGGEQSFATARPHIAFQTGGATDGDHSHATDTPTLKHKLAMANGKITFANQTPHDDDKSITEINMQSGAAIGKGTHSHTISQGGDDETRPINVAVYWIIRFK